MTESTEKLLHIIRGQPVDGVSPAIKHGKAKRLRTSNSSTPRPKTSRMSWKRAKKRCLGVDLRTEELRLALFGGAFNAYLGARHVSYPSGLNPLDPNFPLFLRKTVVSLCGRTDDLQIWSHVASPEMEVFALTIPKVPDWELGEMIAWRVHKDHPFNDKEHVLDFAVQGQVMDQGVAKIAVLACLAPRREIIRLRALFSAANLRLAGLTTAPLAFASFFRSGCCDTSDESFALLDIDRSSSRIDLYTRREMALSRIIKTGMTSMAETLAEDCAELQSAARRAQAKGSESSAEILLSENDDAEIIYSLEDLEQPIPQAGATQPYQGAPQEGGDRIENSFRTEHHTPSDNIDAPLDPAAEPVRMDGESALNLLLGKLADAPISEHLPCQDLPRDKIFEMILPVCERLTRQVERTFDYTTRTLGQPRPERLMLSGDLSVYKGLSANMAQELGATVQILDPLGPGNPLHTPATAKLSVLARQRLNLAAALASCSRHSSINLLHTFLERQEAKARQRANLVVYAAAIGVLLVLSLLYGMEQGTVREKTRTLQQMDARLAALQPQVDEPMLMRLAADLGREQARIANLSSNLKPVALLGEISRLTPQNIRILHLRLDSRSANNPAGKEKSDKSQDHDSKSTAMTMDVLVTGPFEGLNTSLSEYLYTLRNSPLFDVPLIHGKTMEHHPGVGQAMRVMLHLNVPQG